MNQTISIFGLGYVGAVTAGCLAGEDHHVIGVDVQSAKVDALNAGRPSIGEPGLDVLIREARDNAWLSATGDPGLAIGESSVSLVCVGTPSLDNGGLDLSHVENVSRQIREALLRKLESGSRATHTLVYRSTMLPGSTRRLAETFFGDLLASGSVEIFFYPELLRQGNAVADFADPRISVIGALDESKPAASLAKLLPSGTRVLSLESAELLKYACNVFHAAKITFANEIGRLGRKLKVDGREVMKILCEDDRLNISPYYLRPGTPFGGSCLPKDVSALAQFAENASLDLPLTRALLPSNRRHLEHLEALVTAAPSNEVVILGLTFKPDTDDLRGSPLVDLVVDLLARDYVVRIFDPWLDPDRMIGANVILAEEKLPRLRSLLRPNLAEALGRSGTVVAANRCAVTSELVHLLTENHHVIDLNGWPGIEKALGSYEGICWP